MSATHSILDPSRGRLERPCNAWCRDGFHAHVMWTVGDDRPWLLAYLGAVLPDNPGLEILTVEPAPEARPYPDIPKYYDHGWLVFWRIAQEAHQ